MRTPEVFAVPVTPSLAIWSGPPQSSRTLQRHGLLWRCIVGTRPSGIAACHGACRSGGLIEQGPHSRVASDASVEVETAVQPVAEGIVMSEERQRAHARDPLECPEHDVVDI